MPAMAKHSHRDDIISAGLRVIFRSGYNGSSVRDIVAEAGVPQGSFTNHFRSKEGFVEIVLRHYFAHVQGLVRLTTDRLADLAPGADPDVDRICDLILHGDDAAAADVA